MRYYNTIGKRLFATAALLGVTSVLLFFCVGCTSWNLFRANNNVDAEPSDEKRPLVRKYAKMYTPSLYPAKAQAIALVYDLNGTGSAPVADVFCDDLLNELQKKEFESPQKILNDPGTSLVQVMAMLPPGAQRGDRADAQVTVPDNSETISLKGGTLLDARMSEMLVDARRIRRQGTYGRAQGPIFINQEAVAKGQEKAARQGIILGGVTVLESRELIIAPYAKYHKSANTLIQMEKAINRRFQIIRGGIRKDVAKASAHNTVNSTHIQVQVYPRYKHNVQRYSQVLLAISLLSDKPAAVEKQLRELADEIQDPKTCRDAALQLEAIGKKGIPCLKEACKSQDQQVRFAAAEALAYLDDDVAVIYLTDLVREFYTNAELRRRSLLALGAMQSITARDGLMKLLDHTDSQVKVGAFLALMFNNANDGVMPVRALIPPEKLAKYEENPERLRQESFKVYTFDQAKNKPIIYASVANRPEIAVLGSGASFKIDPEKPMRSVNLEVGGKYVINSHEADKIVVTDCSGEFITPSRECSANVDEVIGKLVELGGSYSDVVELLAVAEEKEMLNCDVLFAENEKTKEQLALDKKLAAEKALQQASEKEDKEDSFLTSFGGFFRPKKL